MLLILFFYLFIKVRLGRFLFGVIIIFMQTFTAFNIYFSLWVKEFRESWEPIALPYLKLAVVVLTVVTD